MGAEVVAILSLGAGGSSAEKASTMAATCSWSSGFKPGLAPRAFAPNSALGSRAVCVRTVSPRPSAPKSTLSSSTKPREVRIASVAMDDDACSVSN